MREGEGQIASLGSVIIVLPSVNSLGLLYPLPLRGLHGDIQNDSILDGWEVCTTTKDQIYADMCMCHYGLVYLSTLAQTAARTDGSRHI